jgi:hypothetical protein
MPPATTATMTSQQISQFTMVITQSVQQTFQIANPPWAMGSSSPDQLSQHRQQYHTQAFGPPQSASAPRQQRQLQCQRPPLATGPCQQQQPAPESPSHWQNAPHTWPTNLLGITEPPADRNEDGRRRVPDLPVHSSDHQDPVPTPDLAPAGTPPNQWPQPTDTNERHPPPTIYPDSWTSHADIIPMGWCTFHGKDRLQRYLISNGRGKWVCRPGDFCKGWGPGAREAALSRHHPPAHPTPPSTGTPSWEPTPAAVPTWSPPPSGLVLQPGTGEAPFQVTPGIASQQPNCGQATATGTHPASRQPLESAKAPPRDLIPIPIFGQAPHLFVYATTSPGGPKPGTASAAASSHLPPSHGPQDAPPPEMPTTGTPARERARDHH